MYRYYNCIMKKCLSLFSGIGGFDLAAQRKGYEIVGACEIDKYARQVYSQRFPGIKIWEDATKIDPKELPDFDLLVGGFPCQAFSIAGNRGGFEDARGTLFFEIARIAKQKRPRLLLLENVKGLLNHQGGDTLREIFRVLDEVGYDVEWQVINSKYYVPQNRERIFIIGHRKDVAWKPVFPMGDLNKGLYNENNNETQYADGSCGYQTMYWLSESISKDIGKLSVEKQGQEILATQMQKMSSRLYDELQTKQSREIFKERHEVLKNNKGSIQKNKKFNTSIQEIKRIDTWEQSINKPGEICAVVRIPTENMLLLWSGGKGATNDKGCIQQQNVQTLNRQTELFRRLCEGQYGSLLLAVQSYKGRLFYSFGDGTDWIKLCERKMEIEKNSCVMTLSSILLLPQGTLRSGQD